MPVNAAKWIQERVDPVCHSMKIDEFGILYQNTNEEILEAINHRARFLRKLSQKQIKAHFNGEETRYFNGAHRSAQPESLVGFDIDCHGGGSLQGAIEAAEFLKTNHFPNLYYETSTNGNGVHAYFVIKRMGDGSKAIKSLLKQLETWVKQFVNNHDITDIEVKGTLPIFEWSEGKLVSVKKGQALKLPRIKTDEQAKALMSTTVVDTRFLIKLVAQPSDKSHLPRILGGTAEFSDKKINPEPQVIIKKRKSGSTTADIGEVLGDYLPNLKTQYLKAAYHLTELPIRCLSGREVGTVEDLAIFLMLWDFFESKPNEDGTMPVQRFKKSWQRLYENAHISRQWNDRRFAVLRNHLSELGLIDWIDEEFEYFENRPGEGTACKWKMTSLMQEIIEDCGVLTVQSELKEEKETERENLVETDSTTLPPSPSINHSLRLKTNLQTLERHEMIIPRRRIWTTERVEMLISTIN